jgi:hypothetical protein
MRRRVQFGHVWLVLVLLVALSGCAAGPNPEVGTAAAEASQPAGFWLGLWQGLIAPVTFVVSLFNDNVGIYEVHNSGNLYDFGYVLGLGFLVGGSSAGSRR